jgi:hypothetical protein
MAENGDGAGHGRHGAARQAGQERKQAAGATRHAGEAGAPTPRTRLCLDRVEVYLLPPAPTGRPAASPIAAVRTRCSSCGSDRPAAANSSG